MMEPSEGDQGKGMEQAIAEEAQPTPEEVSSLEVIKGWLILPLLILLVKPVLASLFVFNYLVPIFSGEAWQALTMPGGEFYHHLWKPVLIFKLSGNLTFIFFSIFLLVLFFRRSRLLPKFFVAYLVFNLVFVIVDHYLSNLIPLVASLKDPYSRGKITRSIASAAIWIPYFRVSKRVRKTFVR